MTSLENILSLPKNESVGKHKTKIINAIRKENQKKKKGKKFNQKLIDEIKKELKKNIYNIKTSSKKIKFLILTYKDNLPLAKETKNVLKKDWNIDADIITGYKIGDTNKITKYNVLTHGLKDKIIDVYPNDNIYYLEDDVRFTKNPLDIDLKKDIVWSVYRRGKLTNKPPHNVITGSQAIYFSKKAVKDLKTFLETRRFKHLDGYLSDFVIKHPHLSFEQVVPKMGYEEAHPSLISKEKDWKKYSKPN